VETFAFLVHPINIEQLKNFWPLTKFIPNFFLNPFLKKIPPFKVSCIKNVRSVTGRETEGYIIACPLLPKQILKLKEKFVLNRIIQAGRLAQDLGAKIVGLGGYTSVVADKGITVAKNLNIAVTTGNSYTVALVIESIRKGCQIMNIDLKKARVAIIGATGSIGDASTRMLANEVSEIVITARHKDKLEALKDRVSKISPCRIIIEENAHIAIRNADIVIVTTSTPDALIDASELKLGSVACDVSVPKNISGRNKERKDVFIFDGGLATYPGNIDFGANTELPEGQIYGCLAETMILVLDSRFENFSLGNDLDLEKINKIQKLAKKHGFEEVKIRR